jgi:dienelactone hydrolase
VVKAMAFHNYILLVVSILLIGFLIVSDKQKLAYKAWLKRVVNTTAIIAIVIMTFTVVLFPDLRSVKTTGEYSYASCTLELTDISRIEGYKRDGSFRKLSVLVYYPDTESIKNNTCPLIVFSHGGISTKTSNLSLHKELASHGYVVVSIDHTYHSLITEIGRKKVYIDSGYIEELNTEDSHTDIKNSYECFQKWMKLRTGDINFVIDTFAQASIKQSNSFYSLIDAESIGVAGHSLGGSAALGIARQRNDIKAVIALEAPYMCDIIGVNGNEFTWNTKPYMCAVMNIYSDSGYPLIIADNKYIQNKNYLYSNGNVEYYYIEGSNHYSLTDLVRKSPILCSMFGGGYKKSGYDTLELINQKSLAFFDKYL